MARLEKTNAYGRTTSRCEYLRECPARLTAQLSRENGLATLVIGTAWSGFTIVWDDGETDLVRHNDMKKIERAPTKLVGVPGSEHRLAELAEIGYCNCHGYRPIQITQNRTARALEEEGGSGHCRPRQ